MRRSFAVTACLAALVIAAGCGGSNTPEATATGTIAFWREGQVWLMSADGSGQRALTEGGAPEWSPDGRQLAFDSSSHIYVIAADGGRRLRLTARHEYEHDLYSSPVWSPDGRRIVFQGYDDGDYWLSVVGSDGSGERKLTPGDFGGRGDADATWSPDGRLIAFTNVREGAVYVTKPDGSGRRVLAKIEGASNVWGIAWSPDGRRIACLSEDALWVLNADGTRPRKLVESPGRQWSHYNAIAWSPDGREIAFMQKDRQEQEIFAVGSDGRGLRKLTDDRGVRDQGPVWSPDGRWIAFTSDRDGNTEVYVMDADGRNQSNVSRSPAEDLSPTWSPNS